MNRYEQAVRRHYTAPEQPQVQDLRTGAWVPAGPGPVGEVELVHKVLLAHQVDVDHFRRCPPGSGEGASGWAWWCSCETDGVEAHPDGETARTAAAWHQAQRVAEALAHGAPPLPVGGGSR